MAGAQMVTDLRVKILERLDRLLVPVSLSSFQADMRSCATVVSTANNVGHTPGGPRHGAPSSFSSLSRVPRLSLMMKQR
jgi:hypothetical protein